MSRKYDVIIYGASGYTGVWAVEEAVECNEPGSIINTFTWAVAGRSAQKLQDTLDQVTELTGVDIKNVDKILADSDDPKSLRKMAAQCSVVVNVVGPYRFYGESVVRACIAEGTSHVDISGELQFLEGMQLKYNDKARAEGVYIVGACGCYDSIPADCGVTYLQQNFEGEINSIECYAKMGVKNVWKLGGMNTGTWFSAVHFLANLGELERIRSKLYSKFVPKPKYKAAKRWPLHYNQELKKWCTPFMGVDEAILRRSQYHFFTQDNRRPIQYSAYQENPHLILCFALAFFGFIVYYPNVITLGLVKAGGPSREQAENCTFIFRMTASGWKEKLSESTDHHATPPNKKMKLTIKGSNPAYRSTAATLLQSALVIVQERDKLPKRGGVYTPGVAFENTTLISRIEARGIEFEITDA